MSDEEVAVILIDPLPIIDESQPLRGVVMGIYKVNRADPLKGIPPERLQDCQEGKSILLDHGQLSRAVRRGRKDLPPIQITIGSIVRIEEPEEDCDA